MIGKKNTPLCTMAFSQALGLVVYCGLVALLFWKGNEWFGKIPNYWGPLLFLVLFATSALVSGLLTLGYPFVLEEEETNKSIKVGGLYCQLVGGLYFGTNVTGNTSGEVNNG